MSLLIKGVQIIDGEGKQPFKADVFIQKNLISAIGDLKYKKADETIDGLGNYLTPGFIDIDTDSDHYLHLFSNPRQSDFTAQGVTTIIGGHCGTSLAPLLYGTLESIEGSADVSNVNVNWHTMREFLDSMKRIPLGVNFGTLSGHRTIRDAITRGEQRDLTEQEFKVFEKILEQSIKEGSFGFSTGLGYIHGQYASEKEIKRLVGVLSGTGAVYATHLRNQTDGVLKAIEETVRVSNYNEVKTLISHFRPLLGYEEQFIKALEYIKENTPSGRFYFDIYPHDTSIYPIYKLLPIWVQSDNKTEMLEKLNNPDVSNKIKDELKTFSDKIGEIRIAGAPKNVYLLGRLIREVAKDLEMEIPDALIYIMKITNFKATIFSKDINLELLETLLVNERSFIASNGNSSAPGEFVKHDRSINTFPKFIDLVIDKGIMTLEEAIQKITSTPAKYFSIADRGVIKEGKVADLVILGQNDRKIRETVVAGRTGRGEVLIHKSKR
jgi:N-acyl-D-aspartate/D-glutamate deacylase